MKIEYEVISRRQLNDSVRKIFASMLQKQGKVKGDYLTKADKCKLICIAKIDGEVIAIGGIKEKTASDFSNHKAGIPNLANEFVWELGYIYTDSGYGGRGIASAITRLLIEA